MARRMLGHRLHARRQQPGGKGGPHLADCIRVGGEGAVADHVVGARHRAVQHGGAHDLKPGLRRIQPDQRPGQPRGAQPGGAVCRIELAEPRRWRMRRPVRRAQAGDAAALLVHHRHRQRRQDAGEMAGQLAKLRRVGDIAREQDHAEGAMLPQHGDLGRRKRGTGDPDNAGLQIHRDLLRARSARGE